MDLHSFLPPDSGDFWNPSQQVPQQNVEPDPAVQAQLAPNESLAPSFRAFGSQQDNGVRPDQPVTEDTRARPRNGGLDWERHKSLLKQLWLDNDLKLADIRAEMNSKYFFDAT
jgi:hypothetical protein